MIKRALSVVVVSLGFSLAFTAQSAERNMQGQLGAASSLENGAGLYLYEPDLISSVECSVLLQGLPMFTLLDGRRFPSSTALGRMGLTSYDFLPVGFPSAAPAPRTAASPFYANDDVPEGALDTRSQVYTFGEVGFSYGKSIGRHGGDAMSAYVIGTVGTDKFQVTGGASYQESSGRYFRHPFAR